MSIQRYSPYGSGPGLCHDDNGDYVLYPAHAAEVERLTGERDELQAALDMHRKADLRGIALWQNATGKELVWPDQGNLVEWALAERDAAVRERDAAVEALRFYAEEDRQSVELEILESVDLRPATAALAKIEGGRG